jgi:hypothetical protein
MEEKDLLISVRNIIWKDILVQIRSLKTLYFGQHNEDGTQINL